MSAAAPAKVRKRGTRDDHRSSGDAGINENGRAIGPSIPIERRLGGPNARRQCTSTDSRSLGGGHGTQERSAAKPAFHQP